MILNTPLLWVVLPIIIAVIVGVFHRRALLGVLLTSATAFGLALLAGFFPEDRSLSLGPIMISFVESLEILGRQISLSYEILPFIAFIYAMTGLWALSSNLSGTPKSFRPISLVITALLTAALGVEPFLYAALLIQTAVLASIPMLSGAGGQNQSSILRYLTLQTLALPLILIAGWLLTGVETLPVDSPLIGQSVVLLGLGIALWLSVFPFHSWVPMVSQSSNPNVFSFLMFILPTTVLVFSLNFFDRYTFLRTLPRLNEILQLFGVFMIVMGGFWTGLQDNLKRAFGFSVLTETGFSLLAIGLVKQGGLKWMMLLFPARALGFWLWGYMLTMIENHTQGLDLKSIQGFARRYPILSAGLLLAQLSLAGLPLLGAFPIKISLLTAAFEVQKAIGIWGFIGSLGLFLFTLRVLSHLVAPMDTDSHQTWRLSEKILEFLPVIMMILILIILGIFPQPLLNWIVETLTAFAQLR